MDNKTKGFLQKPKDSGNWNDDYDYSLVEYKNTRTNIIIIYKKFNTKHSINPRDLIKGANCSSRNVIDGYNSINECKKYVHSLNIKREKDWIELRRKKQILP